MAATHETLISYVGASSIDHDFTQQCWIEAKAMVDAYIGSKTGIPTAIRDRAYLECGSELYHRRSAPNGVAQFSTFDGAAIRVARDPMVGVYPLLSRYIVGVG